jgi:hypothetical protein
VRVPRSFIEALHILLWGEVREQATLMDVLDAVAALKREADGGL